MSLETHTYVYMYTVCVLSVYLDVDVVLAVLNGVDVSVEDRVLTGSSRPTISRAQHLNTHTMEHFASRLQIFPLVISQKTFYRPFSDSMKVTGVSRACRKLQKAETVHLAQDWIALTKHWCG